MIKTAARATPAPSKPSQKRRVRTNALVFMAIASPEDVYSQGRRQTGTPHPAVPAEAIERNNHNRRLTPLSSPYVNNVLCSGYFAGKEVPMEKGWLRVMVGKTERFFRFLQERVLDRNQAVSLEELQSLADR
jgi:hypothetical protein